jgi:hypothetical protein
MILQILEIGVLWKYITSALSGSQKSRDSDSLTTQTSSVEREISSSSEDKVSSVDKELSSTHETHVDETTDREHLLSGDTISTTPLLKTL